MRGRVATAIEWVMLGSLLLSPGPALAVDPTAAKPRVYFSPGLSADQVAILLSGEEGGTLQLEQVASLYPAKEGGLYLGVWLEMDFDDLEPPDDGELCLLDLAIYILEDETTISASKSRVGELPCTRTENADGVRFFANFPVAGDRLAPGAYVVRSLVMDRTSRAFAVREARLRIPAVDEPAATAIAIEGLSGWLDVSLDPDAPTPGLVPSARAGVSATAAWTAEFLTRKVERPQLLAAGPGSEAQPLSVEWQTTAAAGGWSRVRGEINLAGNQVLQLEVAVDDTKKPVGTASSTTVVAQEQIVTPVTWAIDSTRRREDPHQTTGNTADRRSRSRLRRGEFIRDLRAALRELAAGAPSALDNLAAVEWQAISVDKVAFDDVAAVELSVFGELMERDQRAILPILDSYRRRYEMHFMDREYSLSTHCRRLATTLAQAVTAASHPDPEMVAKIGDFYTAFGGSRLLNHDPSGRNDLRTAVTFSQDPMPALAVLVWHLELHGRYSDVVRLVDEHPATPPELRLRRSLAAIRLHRSRSALKEIRELAAGDDWTALVATQELARERLADGDIQAAEVLLVDAATRFPRSSRVPLLLAMVRDLRGDRAASAEAIAALARADSTNQRHRYSARPEAWVTVARRRFERQAEAALPRLAAALGGDQ